MSKHITIVHWQIHLKTPFNGQYVVYVPAVGESVHLCKACETVGNRTVQDVFRAELVKI